MVGLSLTLNPAPLERGAARASKSISAIADQADRAEGSLDRLGRTGGRSGGGLDKAGNSAQRVTKVMGRSGRNTLRNFSLQLNQVGQQGAITGRYMQALAFQLPDMLLSFGTAGVLIGAAAGFLTPFIANLIKSSDAASGLKDQIENLSDAMTALGRMRSALSTSVSDVIGQYGAMADKAREVVAIQAKIANVQAQRAFSEAANTLAKALGGVSLAGEATTIRIQALNNAIAAQAEVRRALADAYANGAGALDAEVIRLNENANAMRDIIDGSRDLLSAQTSLQTSFGLSEEAARSLLAPMAELANAKTFEQQVIAAQSLATAIDQTVGSFGDAESGALDLYNNLLKAVQAGLELEGLDLASGIDAASNSASQLAARLGVSLETAAKIAALGPQTANIGAGAGRGGDPREMGGSIFDWQTREAANYTPSAVRSGGASATSAINATADAYERLRASIDPAFAAQQRFADAQETLNDALRAGIINQTEYNALIEMAGVKFSVVSEQMQSVQDSVQGFADTLESSLTDAFSNISDSSITMAERIRGVLEAIIDQLIEVLLVQQIVGSFNAATGVGSGIVGAVMSAISGVFGGFLADGGQAKAGETYIVGEDGPEWLTMGKSGGFVTSNSDAKKLASPKNRRQQEPAKSEVVITLAPELIGKVVKTAATKAVDATVKIVEASNDAQRTAFGGNIQEYNKRGVMP